MATLATAFRMLSTTWQILTDRSEGRAWSLRDEHLGTATVGDALLGCLVPVNGAQ
jgi:hypothetical protein